MGTNDLVKELYAEHVPGRAPILPSLHTALLAARAAGIAILDGVYNDVKDTDGFLAECAQGREMGFDGKTLIHPGQVEGANTAFAPSEQAVEDARGLIAGLRGRPGLRRRHLQRPDGREPPRRVRAPHAQHPRGDPGAGLTAPGRFRSLRPHRVRTVLPPGVTHREEMEMVILGLILLIIGLVASIPVLTTIGAILLVVGLILNLVPMGGTRRRVY